MKNKTKIAIGVGIAVIVIAAVFTGGSGLFKGALIGGSTLKVDLNLATPSSTYVRGTAGADMVNFSLAAGAAENISINSLALRVVADDDLVFDNNGYGDTAANTVIQSVKLYSVNKNGVQTQLGQAALRLVGVIGTPGGYYKAEFTNLNYKIMRSSTVRLLVKADLQNTFTNTRRVAIGLVPKDDIQARGATTNTPPIISDIAGRSSNNIGVSSTPIIQHTILTVGSLSLRVNELTPASAIVLAGATAVPFAKYTVSAVHEAFTVRNLIVTGTSTPNCVFPAFSNFSGGNNVTRVALSYPTRDGSTRIIYGVMDSMDGKATFQNLDFYVAKNSSATVTILADINTIESGAVSGASFRLGLRGVGWHVGDYQSSFGAIGENSGMVVNVDSNLDDSALLRPPYTNMMVVRKSVPTVAKPSNLPNKLVNGQNDIGAVTVAADAHGNVSIRYLGFNFAKANNVTLANFELYKRQGGVSEQNITDQVWIYQSPFNVAVGTGTIIAAWEGGGRSTPTAVGPSLPFEDRVGAGATATYILKATVTNAQVGSYVSTFIDRDVMPLPANYLISRNFNFLWSDLSSSAHGSTTPDWANGYLVPGLPTATHTLVY